ncbi:pentapeptide repeat-containing protein [Hymenobacter algoricola]|uniref:Pentapeptide repeat-containing protein n=1 Tax=Hymenobacter algoricola TaxID=486267 RepID=A0ABP7N7W3_9BACT
MKPRRKPSLSRKPDSFPAENVFERWDAARLLRHGREFEQCHFIGADFSGASLGNLLFVDCLFERCNLASATLAGTGLQNVAFDACKLSGLQFAACRDLLFGVYFEQCQMPYTSFYGRKMPHTRFHGCTLTDADFGGADLTEAVFFDCNLTGALFERTQLSGADLTTATGFSINPETNVLRKARFALSGLPGLLSQHELIIEA